jgi:hypothetical protein
MAAALYFSKTRIFIDQAGVEGEYLSCNLRNLTIIFAQFQKQGR